MEDIPIAKRRRLNPGTQAFGIGCDRPSGGFQLDHAHVHSHTSITQIRQDDEASNYLAKKSIVGDTGEHLHSPQTSLLGLPPCEHTQATLGVIRDSSTTAVQNGYKDNDDAADVSEVCFGMFTIRDISVPDPQLLSPKPGQVRVKVDGGQVLIAQDGGHGEHVVGRIVDKNSSEVVQQLQKQDCLRLQLYCRSKHGLLGRAQPRRDVWVELSVIIYGQPIPGISERIGAFLQSCEVYLQDPEHCDRDVPYSNPHCLSSMESGIVMTSSLWKSTNKLESVQDQSSIFDSLCTNVNLEETESSAKMKTPLKSHQKQGLTFMLRRERGWAVESTKEDVWTTRRTIADNVEYCNNVTGEHQSYPPPEFRGGIIADQMGLGKTVQMLALVAADAELCTPFTHSSKSGSELASTLVVVPLPLLDTWTDQLERHIQPKAVTWHVYHGSKKTSDIKQLTRFDIILTTYDTVVSDHKKYALGGPRQLCLFDVTWRRIVLDEAHLIGRRSTLRTQAMCSLEAHSRWAVTGTPVQNRLTDLGTLLYFLRVHPFDNPRTFDQEFLRPWKAYSDPAVLAKLRALVKFITLRRSKEILHLPPREDRVHKLQFNPAERYSYEMTRSRAREALPELLGSQASVTMNLFNVLAWIDNLRKSCNKSLEKGSSALPSVRLSGPPHSSLQINVYKDDINADSDDLGLRSWSSASVAVDGLSGIEIMESISLQTQQAMSDEPMILGSDPNMFDPGCSELLSTLTNQGVLQVSRECRSPESGSGRGSGRASPDGFTSGTNLKSLPTKIERLVQDLLDGDSAEKSVVFSFWKTTLDLIPPLLDTIGIPYARLDGRLTKAQRSKSLYSFRTDANMKVLLATFSVAGVGLDLTVATRAFLLEPQWNPMAEEQALSRIHRMGQTRAVQTVRYIMEDSIEENIRELQQRKLKLAALTISGGVKPDDHSHLEDLRFLLS